MVLLVLTFICFHNLADAPIYDYDEARHAANAYEMMRDGNLLVNTWGGEADYWNLKPPLSMWLIMVGYAVFGFAPWGVRVPSVVCYILTIVFVVLTARKTWGRGAGLSCCVLALALTKPPSLPISSLPASGIGIVFETRWATLPVRCLLLGLGLLPGSATTGIRSW